MNNKARLAVLTIVLVFITPYMSTAVTYDAQIRQSTGYMPEVYHFDLEFSDFYYPSATFTKVTRQGPYGAKATWKVNCQVFAYREDPTYVAVYVAQWKAEWSPVYGKKIPSRY